MRNLAPIILNDFMYLIHLFVCTQSLIAVAAYPLLPLIPYPSRNSLYPYLALPYCFGMPTSKDYVLTGSVSNTLCHLGPVPLPFLLHLASTPMPGCPCEDRLLTLPKLWDPVLCCHPPTWAYASPANWL